MTNRPPGTARVSRTAGPAATAPPLPSPARSPDPPDRRASRGDATTDADAGDVVDRRTAARRAGDAAEAVAARFLESRGLVTLARQWTRRVGELDLVMVEPDTGTIVFVEVRWRARGGAGGAALSVDARKRRRLRRAASAWLQRHADPRRPARIDVLGLAPAGRDASERWEGRAVAWLPGAVDG